jgi:ankyrin repeat protein
MDRAVTHNKLDHVMEMLDRDPDLANSRGGSGETPLIVCAWNMAGPLVDMMRLLIQRGARVNDRDSMGRTPLFTTIQQNYTAAQVLPLLLILLENGADPSIPDDTGATPIMAATDEVLSHLLMHPAFAETIDARDKQGRTFLLRACEEGRSSECGG